MLDYQSEVKPRATSRSFLADSSMSRMCKLVHTITKLALFWCHIHRSPHLRLRYTPLHVIEGAGEMLVLNATVPTSPPGDQSGGITARGVYCAKNSTDVNEAGYPNFGNLTR